jgi:hypothetical protein
MSRVETTPINILVVDDQPDNLVALKAILNRSDYHLVTASSTGSRQRSNWRGNRSPRNYSGRYSWQRTQASLWYWRLLVCTV